MKKRRFFAYVAASVYHVKITSLDTIEFFENPHWESSGIIILLFKYDSDISHPLVGSILNVLLLLLALILTELHEEQRKNKDWVTEKRSKKNLCEGHHFFGYTPSFLCHFFVDFFVYSLPFSKWCTFRMIQYMILVWMVFCVMISWVNGRKCENLLQFKTSGLASLRTWFYFRLNFAWLWPYINWKSHTKVFIKNKIVKTCFW